METVWKYEVPVGDDIEIMMPEGATILPYVHAASAATLHVWAIVDPSATLSPRRLKVFGTGHPMHEGTYGPHIGTVVASPFVWHLFEGANM